MNIRCLCLLSLTLSAITLFAAPHPKKTTEQLQALAAAHHGDFDYLLGDWEFTTKSTQYGEGEGYWSAARLPTGQIIDEFRIVGDKGETYYVTTTLRAYNAELDRWELVSLGQADGLQDTGTGRREGSEVHIEQTFGAMSAKPNILRIRYYNIQPDRFSWKADRSVDGGKTWTKDDQMIEARRIGPPRTLEPLAPARNGRKI